MENLIKEADETYSHFKHLVDELSETKFLKIIKTIDKDTKSKDPSFCKNKALLYKIYSVLLSSKNYIIILGNGGYGKTKRPLMLLLKVNH